MPVSENEARIVRESARRGAALVALTKAATGGSDVETLVARAMADLRAFSAVSDTDAHVVLEKTLAFLGEMTGDD